MFLRKLLPALIVAVISSPAFAERQTGLVFGPGASFTIKEPTGWTLDYESGKSEGYPMVFYPKGGSWEKSEAVIYINIKKKQTSSSPTVNEVAGSDLETFKRKFPGTTVSQNPSLRTSDGREAEMRVFTDNSANFHSTAFIDQGDTMAMITLSARTRQGFDQSSSAFNEAVSSYEFKTNALTKEDVEGLQNQRDGLLKNEAPEKAPAAKPEEKK